MIEDLDLRAERVIIRHTDWLDDVVLPDPRLLYYQDVLILLRDRNFEGLRDKKITIYSIETIHNLWRAAHDLPEINAAIRLTYVVDHYEEALEYDLRNHLGVNLEELWLHRRWGRLLGYVDRLPSHTWYAQAVSEDPEHTALLAKQLADAETEEEKAQASPPLTTWSPEVAKLADVHDAIKELIHVTVSAHSEKKVPEPVFTRRPRSDLAAQVEKMKFERRKAAHEKLVSRMLPNR